MATFKEGDRVVANSLNDYIFSDADEDGFINEGTSGTVVAVEEIPDSDTLVYVKYDTYNIPLATFEHEINKEEN